MPEKGIFTGISPSTREKLASNIAAMAEHPHVLITAGNTLERIDDVRQWNNIFTGRTGLDIATKMLDVADVTLLTSNAEHVKYACGIRGNAGALNTLGFRSHSELIALIPQCLSQKNYRGVFMTAAVSDYIPDGVFRIISSTPIPDSNPPQANWVVENVQAAKVKGNHQLIAVRGVQSEKIIDLFRTQWNYRGLLYKFKLEVAMSEDELIRIAGESRIQSRADVIVANTLQMVQGNDPGAWIIDGHNSRRVVRKQLAGTLVDDFLNRIK